MRSRQVRGKSPGTLAVPEFLKMLGAGRPKLNVRDIELALGGNRKTAVLEHLQHGTTIAVHFPLDAATRGDVAPQIDFRRRLCRRTLNKLRYV